MHGRRKSACRSLTSVGPCSELAPWRRFRRPLARPATPRGQPSAVARACHRASVHTAQLPVTCVARDSWVKIVAAPPPAHESGRNSRAWHTRHATHACRGAPAASSDHAHESAGCRGHVRSEARWLAAAASLVENPASDRMHAVIKEHMAAVQRRASRVAHRGCTPLRAYKQSHAAQTPRLLILFCIAPPHAFSAT